MHAVPDRIQLGLCLRPVDLCYPVGWSLDRRGVKEALLAATEVWEIEAAKKVADAKAYQGFTVKGQAIPKDMLDEIAKRDAEIKAREAKKVIK